jgi:hypothetical protein
MAHPEVVPVEARSANYSPLMKAKMKAKNGLKVNFCPHGCEDHQLDHNGYCRHLVGFTTDKKTYEPMVRKNGVRVVQVPLVETGEIDEDGTKTKVPNPPPVPKGAKLVQITHSYRVYVENPETPKKSA